MKKLVQALLWLAAFTAATAGTTAALAQQQAAGEARYRIVFHVSEGNPQQWQVALNNAMAFQRNVGKENAALEIVAIGPGLDMLKLESKASDRVAQAMDLGIDIVACGETMKATHVAAADLIGGVRVVPGGLIEIVDRQRAGWTYIHP